METISDPRESVAIVVIGRNEGVRLLTCLHSAVQCARMVVYVDSGSVDGSPHRADLVGCHVLALDALRPFSAARARNEGFAWVMKHAPGVPFVQFVDGDCELSAEWISRGAAALSAENEAGVVCGHLRERFPLASVYNRLCDMEWRKSPGEIQATGGIFMTRAEIFRAAGGFRADVIAAEDDEFCLRVRRGGARILLLEHPMAVHDAAMTRFTEWWRRAGRSGYAYAQGAALHGESAERHFVRDCRRIWLWGFAVPLLSFGLAPFTRGKSLMLLLAYAVQLGRIYQTSRKRGWTCAESLIYSSFAILSKFPALLGLLRYYRDLWRGHAPTIIEYKRISSRT